MVKEEQIRIGVFTEPEMVELFGTESQKRSYRENGRFVSKYKKSMFKTVNRYCKVEKRKKVNGRFTYEITDVYKYPLPLNFDKMNTSLYRYIIPLMIKDIVDICSSGPEITRTFTRWARGINMINDNYNLVHYNVVRFCEGMNCPIPVVDEFFRRVKRTIEWYLTNALNYMESYGLIVWQEVYWVYKEAIGGKPTVDKDLNVSIEVSGNRHRASKEELDYYSDCIAIADKKAKIENAAERYYSTKAKTFKETLSDELYKKGIRRMFKKIEVYCVNLDKCRFLLEQFSIGDIDSFISAFNNDFTEMLIDNAEKRFSKCSGKYNEFIGEADYSSFFKGMCDITISKDMESLKPFMEPKTIRNDYKLKVTFKNSYTK